MSFVAIDLGASSSRYVCENGKLSVLPNNMVYLNNNEVSLITPDAPDIESNLEVTVIKEKPDSQGYFPATVLMGIMAERHPDTNDRPSMNTHKHLQRINYISAIVAAAVCRLKYEISSDIDLYITVPPVEVHKAFDVFNKELTGKYTVNFPKYMGGAQVELNILSVKTYEESLMASTSFFFNMNGQPKEASKQYMSSTVLSLDIGASTTDLAIIEHGRYLDKSGQTYKKGGNIVRDYLINEVREEFGWELPIKNAEQTIAEGRLQVGNTYQDIGELVSRAKAALAKQLTEEMQGYFKRVNIPIQTINIIIVSGGGSMQSHYVNSDGEVVKTSEPMSYYVTQELSTWCPGVEAIEYGDEARFANVKGLFIRAQVDNLKRAKAEKESK